MSADDAGQARATPEAARECDWRAVLERCGAGRPWVCASCGAEVEGGEPFCPHCGRPSDDELFARHGCMSERERLTAAVSADTDPELLVALTKDTTDHYRISYWASLNPSLPKDYVIHQSLAGERWNRIVFIGNGPIPEDVSRRIYAEDDALLSSALAKNADVPEDILLSLAADPRVLVRSAAAGNPHLPEEALATLAQDTDARVRAEVAQSAAATPAILGALAKDASPDIRVRVARNGNTPEEALLALAKDADPDVRSAVCTNPRIPESALLELAADADTWIAEHARKYIRIRRGEAARSADAAAQIRDASESRRERGYVRSFLRHLTLMTEHRGAHDDDR